MNGMELKYIKQFTDIEF